MVFINWLQTHFLFQISRPVLGIKPTNVHRSLHLEQCQPANKDYALSQPNMNWTLCVPVNAQILNIRCFLLQFIEKYAPSLRTRCDVGRVEKDCKIGD